MSSKAESTNQLPESKANNLLALVDQLSYEASWQQIVVIENLR